MPSGQAFGECFDEYMDQTIIQSLTPILIKKYFNPNTNQRIALHINLSN